LHHPRGKLPVAATADYCEVATIPKKIQDARIGEMPEGGDLGAPAIQCRLVIFFPNDLKPAGPVKNSQSRGGKVRQKWHVIRNIAAFLQFIVYI
jgi:hypothetical protein